MWRPCLAAVCVVAALSGCVGFNESADGDVVVGNEGATDREVTVLLDRGSAYPVENRTVAVPAGERVRLAGFVESSDWPYPFYLHVLVDGEHAVSAEQHFQRRINVTLLANGSVRVEEPDRPVSLTPERTFTARAE